MNYPASTTVITLSRPFNLNGKEVTVLEMREPLVADKILYDKNKGGSVEKEVAMIAGLCNLNASDLTNLPAYDFDQLTAAFNDFLLPPEERQNAGC